MKKFILGGLLLVSLFVLPVRVQATTVGAAANPVIPPVITETTVVDTQALIAAQEAQAAQAALQAKALADLQAQQIKAAQDAQAAAILEAQKAQEAQAALIAQAQQAQAALAAQPVIPISATNAAALSKTYPDFVYVSISDQMAYLYRNGLLITQGPCVTGNAASHYDTTVGFHKIVFMDTNRTLRGSYGEAFVKYWMRFTSGGQGLHDAGWRKSFGGNIYKTNGSHGCVNLQRDVAQTIYSYAYVGLPVIVVP